MKTDEEFDKHIEKIFFRGRCDICFAFVDNRNYGYSSSRITSCSSDECLKICQNLEDKQK